MKLLAFIAQKSSSHSSSPYRSTSSRSSLDGFCAPLHQGTRDPRSAVRRMRNGRRTASATPPMRVLVTDVEERSSLAACRGLAQAGYSVTGVAGVTPAPGLWSRVLDRRIVLPDPRTRTPSSMACRRSCSANRTPSSCRAPTSRSASSLRPASASRRTARIALPDRDAVVASLDKRWLVAHAAEFGLATPDSVICSGVEDSLAVAEELGFPIVVKPAFSFTRVGNCYAKEQVTLVEDVAQAVAVVPRYGASFIVQRYLDTGRVISSAGVMTPAGLLAFGVVRWQRRWPVKSGATSFCLTVTPPEGLAAMVEQLLLRSASRVSSNSSCWSSKMDSSPPSTSIRGSLAGCRYRSQRVRTCRSYCAIGYLRTRPRRLHLRRPCSLP